MSTDSHSNKQDKRPDGSYPGESSTQREERERIVASIMAKKPAEVENDLDRLMNRYKMAISLVRGHMATIIDLALTSSSIHTEKGREMFLTQAVKFGCDYLKDFSYDELLWLLAFENARRILEENA